MSETSTKKIEEFLIKNDPEYQSRKVTFLQWFGIVTAFLIFIYALINFYVSDYWAFFLELSVSMALASAVWITYRTGELYPAVNVGLLGGIIMIWQNFYSSGFEGTGIFWIFIAPTVTFFLVGSKSALRWNLLVYAGLIVIYGLMKLGVIEFHYDDFTVLMMFLILTIISGVIFVYQAGIEAYNLRILENKKEIEELSVLREKFIRIVSHQLRTPLNSVRWNLELLVDELKEEDYVKQLVSDAYKATLDSISQVSYMFMAISIKEGKVKLEKEDVNVVEIIGVELKRLRNAFPDRRSYLDLEGINQSRLIINADKEKLEFIIKALLDNAFQYTLKGGAISISLEKSEPDSITLTIKDDGIGIPLSDQSQIFGLFYNGSNAKGANTQATGVGLFVTKSFVEMHGGEISYVSKENKGTTFTVVLPLK